ncbi:MAG: efflux RND transporter periplasmic adaptor subunit [Bacteroidia bacterium]
MQRVIVWIIFGALFFIGGLVGGMMSQMQKPADESSKKEEKENHNSEVKYYHAQRVNNDTIQLVITTKGRVIDGQQINLVAEVQGKILYGDVNLKKGSSFKKNQLIAKIDHTEAELLLKARKSSFINLVANILPDIKVDYSENYVFWNKFFELISVGNALPDLPPFKGSDQEFIRFRNFLVAKNFMAEYYSIRSEEERFRKYYIYAPFDGSITDAFADAGMVINPGATIVRIAKKDVKEIEVPVSSASINKVFLNADVDIETEKGEKLKGRVTRKSDFINPLTQSVSVFIEIISPTTNVYSGQYVTANIQGTELSNVFKTTRRALQTNNKVYVISDSLLTEKEIIVEHLAENDVIISNLSNNDILVIVPVLGNKKRQKAAAIFKD